MRSLAFAAGLLSVVASAVLCTGASAREALDPGLYDESWKGIVFGSTRADVEEFLRRRIRARYEPRIQDAMDVRIRDALTREMKSRIARVGKNYVDFDKSGNAWDVSVVKGEFRKGFGEGMLDVHEGKEHTYLFFTKGVFYKMIRTVVDAPGKAVLARLVGLYGEPTSKEQDRGGMTARWEAGLLTLKMAEKGGLIRCICLRWALKTADEQVKASWKLTEHGNEGLDPLVREAMEPPKTRRKVDPVDEILGKQGGK